MTKLNSVLTNHVLLGYKRSIFKYNVCSFVGQLCQISILIAFPFYFFLTERRTTDSQVSGSINLNLSASVENDVSIAPFHDQYMRLHEVRHA